MSPLPSALVKDFAKPQLAFPPVDTVYTRDSASDSQRYMNIVPTETQFVNAADYSYWSPYTAMNGAGCQATSFRGARPDLTIQQTSAAAQCAAPHSGVDTPYRPNAKTIIAAEWEATRSGERRVDQDRYPEVPSPYGRTTTYLGAPKQTMNGCESASASYGGLGTSQCTVTSGDLALGPPVNAHFFANTVADLHGMPQNSRSGGWMPSGMPTSQTSLASLA